MIVIDGIVFSIQRHGGISVYFQKLLDCLKQHHVQATLVLESPCRQDVRDSDESVSLIRRSAGFFERYRTCRIPRSASVFHSSYYRQPNDRSVPTVVTVHDFIYERYAKGPKRWVHMRQKHAAIRAAHAVICVSEATRQDLMEFVGEIPGQIVHVIHNGVTEVFRSLSQCYAPAPYVLYVGQRGGYKNFDLALKAMTFLPEFKLYCVGGGSLQPRELMGVASSVASRVRHVGFVDDDALNVFYNQAVCLVYPSSYEGFGIPVVEAMRAGCPVVAIECKAVIEVGGDALTVAEGRDPKALANAIMKTVSSDRCSIIEKGLFVSQDYSWNETHSRTLNVYRSLGG